MKKMHVLTIVLIFALILVGLVIILLAENNSTTLSESTNKANGYDSEQNMPVRKASVVGTFYPDNPHQLEEKLTGYLTGIKKNPNVDKTRVLILPHAGLSYSGKTAAAGYKQAEGQDINKVILLGSSHVKHFEHAAVFALGKWETVLGDIIIDDQLAGKIISKGQNIVNDPQIHNNDHNLEMQALWIKKLFPQAKIVPIMVSATSDELIATLAFRIAANFDEQTLLVISSDLAHYPNQETAKAVDSETIKAILTGDADEFEKYILTSGNNRHPKVDTLACGHEAIKIGLKTAELLGFDKPELFDYSNSADSTEDKTRVVGYAAVGISAKEIKLTVPQLDEAAQKEALELAKNSLKDYFAGKSGQKPVIENKNLLLPLGAFVTLKNNGDLRGCIGEFEPEKPLYKVIMEKAVDAATKDGRFEPVTAEELNVISLEISVMSPKRKVLTWKDIDLTKDGVVMISGGRSGTFLPQVAKETGWSREEYLSQLCSQKLGLSKDCYLKPESEFFVYSAQVYD